MRNIAVQPRLVGLLSLHGLQNVDHKWETDMSLALINRAIARIDPRCELVKGDGYHYFAFDDQASNVYETESVMVMYTSHMSKSRWISEAQDFINNVILEAALMSGVDLTKKEEK